MNKISNMLNNSIRKHPKFFKVFTPVAWCIDFIVVLYWGVLYRGFSIKEIISSFILSCVQLGFMLLAVSLIFEFVIDKYELANNFKYCITLFTNKKLLIFIIFALIAVLIFYIKINSRSFITIFATKNKFMKVNEIMFKTKTNEDIYNLSNIVCDDFNFKTSTKCELTLQTTRITNFSKALDLIAVGRYDEADSIVNGEPSYETIYLTYFWEIDLFGNILKIYNVSGDEI